MSKNMNDDLAIVITPVQNAIATADFETLVAAINKHIDDLDIDNIEPTEENKATLKNIRKNLNAKLSEIEAERKRVESILFADYKAFLEDYKERLKSVIESASKKLTEKINSIEEEQKERIRNYAKSFFEEMVNEKQIFVLDSFEDVELTIGVNTTEKQVRTQILSHFTLVEEAQNTALGLPEEKQEQFLKLFTDTRDIQQSLFMVMNVKDDVKIDDVIRSTNIVPRKEYEFTLRLSDNELKMLNEFIHKNLNHSAIIKIKGL